MKTISAEDRCKCGHKRIVHNKNGCEYCKFIEGRNPNHTFKEQNEVNN